MNLFSNKKDKFSFKNPIMIHLFPIKYLYKYYLNIYNQVPTVNDNNNCFIL